MLRKVKVFAKTFTFVFKVTPAAFLSRSGTATLAADPQGHLTRAAKTGTRIMRIAANKVVTIDIRSKTMPTS
jgi:hypothetical protein